MDFFVIVLLACLFVQLNATKRKNTESSGLTSGQADKIPLPFDLNQPPPIDEDEELRRKRAKLRPVKKKSSEFYKNKYRRFKERMAKDPKLQQSHRESQARSKRKQKDNMTKEQQQASKEAIKVKNHLYYLRKKAKFGVQISKQRREITQIKTQMKVGQVSEGDRKKVEDYYVKKRKRERKYYPIRTQRRGRKEESNEQNLQEESRPTQD